VAAHAGVSTTTVSYFISGRNSVCSPETAEKIRRAVEQLHYTPSSLVAGMQKSVRQSIGICMWSHMDVHLQYGAFFFERVWRGVFDQVDIDDYSLLRYQASVRDSDSCDAFIDGRVDGVLFHAHADDNKRPAKIAAAGMPIVLITRSIDLPEGCGAAYFDEDEGVDLALTYLWNQGHRRIAHIAGPIKSGSGATEVVDDIAIWRMRSYERWMTERGATPRAEAAASWDGADVGNIIDRWSKMALRPTAIFCANDQLAIAAIHETALRGWRVPHDVSIIGVDNSDNGRYAETPLTTIDVPIEQVGRESVKALIRMMDGAGTKPVRKIVPGAKIVERLSVRPVHE
jgi:LacI family transcriptional regulator